MALNFNFLNLVYDKLMISSLLQNT